MCGAMLESHEDAATTSDAVASGRVRQQTTSVAGGEVQARSAEPSIPQPVRPSVEETSSADPLQGYVEEVSIEPHEPTTNGNGADYAHENRKSAERPEVVVDSGMKKGGLSFGKPAPREEAQVEPPQPSKPQPEREPLSFEKPRVEQQAKVEQVTEEDDSEVDEFEFEDVVENRPKRKRKRKKKDRGNMQSEEHVADTHQSSSRPAKVVQADEVSGRLVGWLVDYSDPEGEAIELRESQFFITRDRLKKNDLLIDDPSLSTPHAMVRIRANSFEIQDLMSERGVFVRRQNNDAYKKQEDRLRLDHGDWVRFGDIEYLVVLVPLKKER